MVLIDSFSKTGGGVGSLVGVTKNVSFTSWMGKVAGLDGKVGERWESLGCDAGETDVRVSLAPSQD
jgi:hypothetical protein